MVEWKLAVWGMRRLRRCVCPISCVGLRAVMGASALAVHDADAGTNWADVPAKVIRRAD